VNNDADNEYPGILLGNEPELALDAGETTEVTEGDTVMDGITLITETIMDGPDATGVDASANNTITDNATATATDTATDTSTDTDTDTDTDIDIDTDAIDEPENAGVPDSETVGVPTDASTDDDTIVDDEDSKGR
jgi:hypothetical protein